MIQSHMASLEGALLAQFGVQDNTGHSLHKGTPRESFVRDFLSQHLSQNLAVGTGEIIDANSKPREARNQIDIVVYRRDYPRLDFGGGINGFLAESVVATISVKSKLQQAEFEEDMRTAQRLKRLNRNVVSVFQAGYAPPSMLNYVVAYDGPAKMETVHGWIGRMNDDVPYLCLPVGEVNRVRYAATGLDAIFVLGKGFIHYGNAPLGFFTDADLQKNSESKWVVGDANRGSLLLLFVMLTAAAAGVSASWLNPLPYLKGFTLESGATKVLP